MSEGEVNIGAWIGGTIGVILGLILIGWLIRFVIVITNEVKSYHLNVTALLYKYLYVSYHKSLFLNMFSLAIQ